ncbi:MAG: hypothetical protein GX442_16555 [Candidatus Riflebacteria bacterium]|nr:hypothetical protein [Candidatus Riflebacteria bacterium]
METHLAWRNLALVMVLMFAVTCFAEVDLDETLSQHDPKGSGGQALQAQTSNTPAPAAAPAPAADDPWIRIMTRLTNIFDRLTKIFEKLVAIKGKNPSGKKPKDEKADKDKPAKDKPKPGKDTTTGPKQPEVSGNRVYVDCPKRTQFDPANGQYQNSWCGPTSLGMVYQYYGRKETTKSIASRVYTPGYGTDAWKVSADPKKNGFPGTYMKEKADIAFLRARLKEGKPVIVNVEVAWSSGHYMVVVGLDGDKVIVNDPGRTEVRREFSTSWFLSQWNGRNRRAIVIQK